MVSAEAEVIEEDEELRVLEVAPEVRVLEVSEAHPGVEVVEVIESSHANYRLSWGTRHVAVTIGPSIDTKPIISDSFRNFKGEEQPEEPQEVEQGEAEEGHLEAEKVVSGPKEARRWS